jgi:hypothetical protein
MENKYLVRVVFSDVESYSFDTFLSTDILISLAEEQFCRSYCVSNICFKDVISSAPYSWPIHICSRYLFSVMVATELMPSYTSQQPKIGPT